MKVEEYREGEQLTLCGTPNYLAPEVIMKCPYGKEADLWSLGCLLYTLVVGRPPFESSDVRDTFSKVKRGDFRVPDTVAPLVTDLIQRLIIVDPMQRISLEQVRRHPFLLPPSVPTFKQSGTVSIHAPPIVTSKLKPIKQCTKHGYLQIRASDKSLIVDYDGLADVMVVSADGLRVNLYARPFRDTAQSYGDAPPPPPPPIASYQYPTTLPADQMKRYEYGRRFVNLVRSKTPQIALITDSFKAFLMDNPNPPWDFQVRYGNGMRVEYCPRDGGGTVIIRGAGEGKELIKWRRLRVWIQCRI